MAVQPRHKKAKLLRDYMIQTDMIKMFKEEEKDDHILFRTLYPMAEDKKPVVLTINDSIYLALQILIVQNIPEEKAEEVLTLLNECNLELPAVKYVLTQDHCIVISMFFPVDENHFNPALILGTMMQVLKTVSERHYAKIKNFLA